MELIVPEQVKIELPENKFEQVLYLEGLAVKLNEFLNDVVTKSNELKTELQGVEDPKYKVVPVFDVRKTTLIDEDSLKKDNPEVYKNCLTITGANAMKLIGEEKMMQLCMKYAGEERTLSASNITLKQMKKVMTDEEFKKYTKEIYKEKGLAVEEHN